MSREREERRARGQPRATSAELGPRLRSLIRRETNLQQLAAKAGVSAATLYEWLGGRREPSLTNAKKLAAALNVSLEWLATGKGAMGAGEVSRQGVALQFAKKEEMELVGELRRIRNAIERLAQSYRNGQIQLMAALRAGRRPQGKNARPKPWPTKS
jgi:transcriptional regulator with XRE-family HTH domain